MRWEYGDSTSIVLNDDKGTGLSDKNLTFISSRCRTDRQEIEDPTAAAVGCDCKYVLRLLHNDIVDVHGWQSRSENIPAVAAVDRNVDGSICAEIEDFSVLRILPDDICAFAGAVAANVGPGLSIVGGFEDVRAEVVVPFSADRDVDRALIEP